MKEKNWYTRTLFFVGLLLPVLHAVHFHIDTVTDYLLLTLFVIILDLFPIRLPSGEVYNFGVTGNLFLLFKFGLAASAVSMAVSLFILFLTTYKSVKKINWFRFFTSLGIYMVCLQISSIMIVWTVALNVYIRTILAFGLFELANTFLIAGIFATMTGQSIFKDFLQKIKELLVPTLVCLVVLPRFLLIQENETLITEILYTGFFLMVILVFANQFVKEYIYRNNITKQFVKLLESRNTPELMGHGIRVSKICEEIIGLVGYQSKHKSNLIQLAMIHDIGNSLLPDHLFQKRGALTLSEEKESQKHCQMGAEIVKSAFDSEEYASWILHLHERWDGKGFPVGLRGEEIPLESRILGISNHLDHLLRRNSDDETVLQVLKQLSGSLFDPALVLHFDIQSIASIRKLLPVVEDSATEKETMEEARFELNQQLGRSYFRRIRRDELQRSHDALELDSVVLKFAQMASDEQRLLSEQIPIEGSLYEVYFYPESEEILIFGYEVSHLIEYRQKLTFEICESYRDVIHTLTHGKVILCLHENEIAEQLGEYHDEIPVQTAQDVAHSRNFVSKLISEMNTNQSKLRIQLAVSEGATNLIKHATNGKMSIYKKVNTLQVLFTDSGSGIPIHEIPKTILISGYSTKHSLGKGFSIMSKAVEQIFLQTSLKGTMLLLEFSLSQ